jgi:hypothetical protein
MAREQWDFQNNEKIMEHSDHWIVTGWHGGHWDFQNNEKKKKIYCTVLQQLSSHAYMIESRYKLINKRQCKM